MRLTNQMRDAYVAAVMQGLPRKDYKELIRKAVADDSKKQLPAPIAALLGTEYQYHVYMRSFWCGCVNVMVYDTIHHAFGLSAKVREKVIEYTRAQDEQDKRDTELKSKLRGVVTACTTTQQLVDALPEFAKHVPADAPAASRALPAITGVADAFKQAGWKAAS